MGIWLPAAWLLIGLGALIALGNWWIMARNRATGEFESCIPIIGGLMLCFGLFLLPTSRTYSWLGLLIDPGTLLLFIALPRLAKEAYATSPMQLESAFRGHGNGLEVELRLYRTRRWVLTRRRTQKPQEFGAVFMSQTGTFQLEDHMLILKLLETGIVFERISVDGLEGWRNTSEDPDTLLSIYGIDLIRMA